MVLLSSASTPICQPVSRHLGLDEIICTHLETENGVLTGKTRGKLVYGVEKKVRMQEFCRERKFDPKDAWYYGDSYTDRYVMEAVGNPVAVSPDKKLLKLAKRKDWHILL